MIDSHYQSTMKTQNILSKPTLMKKPQNRKHFCLYCLQCFTTEDKLNSHKTERLIINGQQAIKMLDER